MPRPIMLGLVGDSASGKTTLTRGLVRILGEDQVTHISADHYHRYDRRQRVERGLTPLSPECNYLDILEQHVAHLRPRDCEQPGAQFVRFTKCRESKRGVGEGVGGGARLLPVAVAVAVPVEGVGVDRHQEQEVGEGEVGQDAPTPEQPLQVLELLGLEIGVAQGQLGGRRHQDPVADTGTG